MANEINYEDNLRQGTDKLNESIRDANKAKSDSEQALNTANEAKESADSTRTELNAVVERETDSDAMSRQAAIDETGHDHRNLKARLDTQHGQVSSQLAQTTNIQKNIKQQTNIANTTEKLNIVNYLGNNQNIHPKVLYFENGWNGYKYWMGYTPYPYNNTDAENPCIAVSNNMMDWTIPVGLTNPLDPTPPIGYNSDTHLVYRDDTDTLEIWWRQYVDSSNRIIYRRTTKDGVNWTDKEAVFENLSYTEDMLSPSIIFEEGRYKMWYSVSGGGSDIFYIETVGDTISDWSGGIGFSGTRFDVGLREENLYLWHLDVIRTDLGYEYILNCRDQDDPDRTLSLYHVMESNGEFTKPKPIMKPNYNINAIDSRQLYRSTAVKVDGLYYLFYTGMAQSGINSIGLSVGDRLTNLVGYEKKVKNVLEVTDNEVHSLDVTGKDTVKFMGTGVTTVHSLSRGYQGERVVLTIGEGTKEKVILKNGVNMNLKDGGDYVLNSISSPIELVYTGEWWRMLSQPRKVRLTISPTDDTTNLNVSGVDVIECVGSGDLVIESITPLSSPQIGKKISIIKKSNVLNKVVLKNGAHMALPNSFDYSIRSVRRPVELIWNGSHWTIVGEIPTHYLDITESTVNDLDVNGISLVHILTQGDVTINTINEGYIGQRIIIMKSLGVTDNVTIKHGETMFFSNAQDYVISSTTDIVELVYNGNWWMKVN